MHLLTSLPAQSSNMEPHKVNHRAHNIPKQIKVNYYRLHGAPHRKETQLVILVKLQACPQNVHFSTPWDFTPSLSGTAPPIQSCNSMLCCFPSKAIPCAAHTVRIFSGWCVRNTAMPSKSLPPWQDYLPGSWVASPSRERNLSQLTPPEAHQL